MNENEFAERGVLKRHAKPTYDDGHPSDDDEDHDEQYAQLEDHFRQKFSEQDRQQKQMSRKQPNSNRNARQQQQQPKPQKSTPSKPQSDYKELAEMKAMAGMYKKLLDQTLEGLKQSQQNNRKKPLTDKQVVRNEKARQQMLEYHAKKKAAKETSEPVVKEPVSNNPTKDEPKPEVSKQAPQPPTRNFFADLRRRR